MASEKRKKRVYNPETGIKISLAQKGISKGVGKVLTATHKKNISINNNKNKPVINLETGIYYCNISDAAESYSINRNTLKGYLSGKRKNKTNLVYA